MFRFIIFLSICVFSNAVPYQKSAISSSSSPTDSSSSSSNIASSNNGNKVLQRELQSSPSSQDHSIIVPGYGNSEDLRISEKDNQYSASQILENPSYDPNLYSSFIPQDAVQQYVNQYGGPYIPGSYVPAAYPGPFAIQTGYDGYLVDSIDSTTETYNFFRSLFPRTMIGWIGKAAAILISALGVVFFGGAITTAICSLTPLCKISFANIPFLRMDEVAAENISRAIGVEVSPERLRRTAEFVQAAVKKYSEMQLEEEKKDNREQNVQRIPAGTGRR